MLKRTGVFVYNSTAKLIGSAEHIFSSPGIEVSKDRMLVFDRTSGEYFLHNRTEKLFDGSLGRQIFAGAMGAKGGYALASTADDACSRLLVYSAKNEKRLEFFCSKEYIVAVALSKDEKNVCIAVVGSDAAEIYSSVYVLSVDSGKELFKKSYTGTTMMKVRYLERNAIAAVGDNKCVIFDQSGQVVAENTFPYCTLENLSFSADGKVALLLSRFGSVNDYFLRVIGSDGNVMYEKNYGERRLWVSSDSSEVAVVSQDGEVELYNNKGEVTAKATCGNPLRIVCGARNCYALEYGCISEIKVERIKN